MCGRDGVPDGGNAIPDGGNAIPDGGNAIPDGGNAATGAVPRTDSGGSAATRTGPHIWLLEWPPLPPFRPSSTYRTRPKIGARKTTMAHRNAGCSLFLRASWYTQ